MGFWSKLAGIGVAAAGAITGNPGLIAAGGGIIANDVKKEGVKKAVAQQQAATDKSTGILSQVHDRAQATFSPYINTGQQALGSLGEMVGLPRQQMPQAQPMGGSPQTLGALVAPQQTGSSYVRMRAPNGMESQVPSDQVEHFRAKGAQVVGS